MLCDVPNKFETAECERGTCQTNGYPAILLWLYDQLVWEQYQRRRILIHQLEGGVTFYGIADVNNSDEQKIILHMVYEATSYIPDVH